MKPAIPFIVKYKNICKEDKVVVVAPRNPHPGGRKGPDDRQYAVGPKAKFARAKAQKEREAKWLKLKPKKIKN